MSLLFDKTTFAWAVAKRLILQRALAAFIANRAIEWMICQQQFEHTLLGFFDAISCCAHNLTLGHWRHARHNHHRSARCFYFNKTLPTHADRRHSRVITKSWDEIFSAISRRNNQFAFSCDNRFVIDRNIDHIRVNRCRLFNRINNCHADTPTLAVSVATAVTGIVTRFFTRASNSLLKRVNAE